MPGRDVGGGAVAGAAGMLAVALARVAAGGERALSRGLFQPPPPAQLAGGVWRTVTGRRAARRHSMLLNVAMHALYGPGAGIAYATGRRRLRGSVATIVLFAGLWGGRLAVLPGLGLRKPFWRYSARENAIDAGYHAAYVLGVAACYAALRRL